MNTLEPDRLFSELAAGNRAALARAITWAESDHAGSRDILRQAFAASGSAPRFGITGPPGAGKSTLIDKLIQGYRGQRDSVAVAAVDPTSPFSGGALLGDRVRMQDAASDDGVFIRSMATRGSLGGIAAATEDVLDLFDAAGFDRILLETVGVGQVELDVARAAHTVLVVLVPESGDGIQTMKAGLMEIGDVFAVNKSDREGADRLVKELESMLDLKQDKTWRPPVIKTSAVSGDGVAAVLEALEGHRGLPPEATRERRLRALRERVLDIGRKQLQQAVPEGSPGLDDLVREVAARRMSPADAASRLTGVHEGRTHG